MILQTEPQLQPQSLPQQLYMGFVNPPVPTVSRGAADTIHSTGFPCLLRTASLSTCSEWPSRPDIVAVRGEGSMEAGSVEGDTRYCGKKTGRLRQLRIVLWDGVFGVST
jgi:hypothetical protein